MSEQENTNLVQLREMNTLRAMLNEAKINDWITVNPFTKGRPGELISTADEQPRETILTSSSAP